LCAEVASNCKYWSCVLSTLFMPCSFVGTSGMMIGRKVLGMFVAGVLSFPIQVEVAAKPSQLDSSEHLARGRLQAVQVDRPLLV